MKKFFSLLALALALGFVMRSLQPPKNPTAFDVVGFSKLPVILNGRFKPIDTVARSSLLQLQGRQRVSSPTVDEPLAASPTEWLLEVMFRPEKADTFPTFAIDNPDLLALIGKTEDKLKISYGSTAKQVLSVVGFIPSHHRRFSLEEIKPFIPAIQAQYKLAQPIEAGIRTPFQRAVVQLYGNLVHYQQLRHALVAPGRPDFLTELLKLQENLAASVTAVRARQANQPHDEALVKSAMDISEQFWIMSESTNILAIPPEGATTDLTAWRTAGAALLDTFRAGHMNPSALAYAGFAHAWRDEKPEQFNKLIELYRADLDKRFGPQMKKSDVEVRFNQAEPFYTSMSLYGLAFFVAVFSWLVWPEALSRAAFWFVGVAWVVATGGILMRMWLEGRPPVTNLYSSALFVGWGAVTLCLALEYFYRNAIGSMAAGIVGFATLLIAHHLSLSGDTLEMMRAVLDSNFWLATHVVVVTAGYAATFLAGFLALIYVVMGVLTPWLGRPFSARATDTNSRKPASAGARAKIETNADALARMVYGIVCFATLFSFVGTILGGIWADQSWGRFWGWDPKENGALIIVIWNAIILHARWGGMIKQRGLMCLAIGGNIATAWSWFGTNMLGVGLHSYGFTDAAFVALTGFGISQALMILLANLPLHKWRSFAAKSVPQPASEPALVGK